MLYICDKCNFVFKRVGQPEGCPNCANFNVREATKEEISRYEQEKENKKP